jgi:hypothetical protein
MTKADPDAVFHSDADPDPASKNDADPSWSTTLLMQMLCIQY